MGNKIGRRQVVDEKYTRPQGLYHLRDIDQKKLRKLIRHSKLAPCYPGDDDYTLDREECPICFLYYPSLNRSRCCTKGICTECFLQMKPPNCTRPTQCPFCKTSNYAVEYRGVKSKEEKSKEELEEQRVLEAQIRIRQQELQDEVERMKKRQDITSSSIIMTPAEVEYRDICHHSLSVPSFTCTGPGDESVSCQASCSALASTLPSNSRQNRDDNFDLDLEDIMVMEAIWLSIQEQGHQGNPAPDGNVLPEQSLPEHCYDSLAGTPLIVSPSGGLASAVAALAECQHITGDSDNVAGSSASVFDMLPPSSSIPSGNGSEAENIPPGSWLEASTDGGREPRKVVHWSEMPEEVIGYASSDAMVDAESAALPPPEGVMAAGHLIPESFEEQMMLAMAVSLAEARARTSAQGLTWL